MADEPTKSPFDQLWELCVYAPIGLVFSLHELAPELVNKGRQQVNMARFVGTVASRKINKLVSSANPLQRSAEPSGSTTHDTAPDTATVQSAPLAGRSAAHLALADYDSLAASQIVARLDSLTPGDLLAVHEYESNGRSRRTILAKIHQLNPDL